MTRPSSNAARDCIELRRSSAAGIPTAYLTCRQEIGDSPAASRRCAHDWFDTV